MINPTAASVLGFLTSGPKTGWELTRTIEESIGDFWNVTRSQVYRELSALAGDGLVRAGKVGPRDRQPYEITAAGRKAFAEWINREPGFDIIRSPLLLTAFFSEHLDPERLQRFLGVHRAHHQTKLEEYEHLRELCGDEVNGIVDALDFGIAHERMVLGWLDTVASKAGK